ncbi:MAG: hypothetical protein ACON4T_05765 [Synechococcus sp.]
MAPRISLSLSSSLVPLSLALVTATTSGPVRAADDQGLITQFCLASFNAAMASAGKTPPPGMGPFTCSCFLDEVQNSASIDAAQSTCKAKAASRYSI